MKLRPLLTVIGLLTALLALCGCDTLTLSNLTSRNVPQNPSNIYTLSVQTHREDNDIIEESIKPMVVIDGLERPMHPIAAGAEVFAYDFTMPGGRHAAKYYYCLNYKVRRPGKITDEQLKSPMYDLNVVNRYVVSLETARGPVGSTGVVMGRGFSSMDQVLFDGKAIPTVCKDPHLLTFTVPAIPAGRAYFVSVNTGKGTLPAGTFTIDSAQLRVMAEGVPFEQLQQRGITLDSAASTTLIFTIDAPAPQGGVYLDITTNIPQSVIMDPVMIAQGTRTVSANITGGEAGQGTLYISAAGFKEIRIPLCVEGAPDVPEQSATVEETVYYTPSNAAEVVVIDAIGDQGAAQNASTEPAVYQF